MIELNQRYANTIFIGENKTKRIDDHISPETNIERNLGRRKTWKKLV